MQIQERVIKGRANLSEFLLSGRRPDGTSITDFSGIVSAHLDVETPGGADVVEVPLMHTGNVLSAKLGLVPELQSGATYRASVITLDPDNVEGIFWGAVILQVVEEL